MAEHSAGTPERGVMLSVAVMAHPKRRARAEALAVELDARIVWDQHDDEWDTGARALAAIEPGATHHLVIQDDAVPAPGFLDHAAAAIVCHPSSPISFYLGRSRPPGYQRRIMRATLTADERHASWLSCPELLHGVGFALPVAHIPTMLAWAAGRREPYDERIGKWYRHQNTDVLYTWPSLLDHADDEPVIQHRADRQSRTEPRKAWRHGIPAWGSDEVIAL